MPNRIRTWISALFYYSGMLKLLRWWVRRTERGLVILYYHTATGKNLRNQWLYLRRHYCILNLEEALQELYTPNNKGRRAKDRRTPLVLTFDDGYDDNYTQAFRLATELQIPITIFLIAGYIESGHAFWWADRLIRLTQVEQVSFEGHTYDLAGQEERKALAQSIDKRVSQAASAAEREQLLVSICEMLALPYSAIPREEALPLLSWSQVREMQESGWVAFGAHTLHHPDLNQLADPSEVQREVETCRPILGQRLGHTVNTFAYPYGHIGAHGLSAVRQAGYKWAVTTLPGLNTCQTSPYLLRRRDVDADRPVLVVAAKAAGLWNFFTRRKRLATPLLVGISKIA